MVSSDHMMAAIRAAKSARANGDYAVGAVIALGGREVSAGGNRTHLDEEPTQHAEMIAIRDASATLRTKNLSGCFLYSTHEPCPMCMSAAIWARISTVVFGATMADHKEFRDSFGNVRWPWRVIDIPAEEVAARSQSDIQIVPGYMRESCIKLFHD